MKHVPAELAAFGGAPAFSTPRSVGRPNIGDRAALFARLNAALDRGWLSNGGPLAEEFEQRVAAVAGTRFCVATCNATAGLQLALRASGVTGEVIVPSLTFAATAHAVAWLGLTPVFCDVDPVTGALDPEHARSLIGPRTGAILAVHVWGRPAPVRELEELAADHRLRLFFDAAHAFACTSGGRPIGGGGDGEVFSFHSTKFVNSFEGGALVTDDPELAERARRMRNFGIAEAERVELVGLNAKLNEAAAAMGLTSLDSMDRFIAHNRENYHAYRAGLAGLPGITLLEFDERERNNYQYMIVAVDERRAGFDRDTLLAILASENVLGRAYFSPGCHQMLPYADGTRLPHTERLASQVLALPTGIAVSAADAATIAGIIRVAARQATTPAHAA
ncbi:aminotransferase class I/II-fold pyridoxal phosphate-dependent enzyme [Winogradskya consettensis]|uniref:dTDP-4-dehydro-6-deoxyglucose aminotransferase n=1 Tax=Winogradskya consettensis TaxID=113560 RepID=A0A919SD73_9ACTN|nr:aminotransferase class I/II-fold pyridoxal phosphate-dependent enzyme [Actinoplanes consettensis]GIM68457.1 dTDP-4-dehydro-6-deoxyglucose aminotransferase [Actinoplanes consettensis]